MSPRTWSKWPTQSWSYSTIGMNVERLVHTASAFYQKHNIKVQADRYLDLLTASRVSLRVGSERHA